MLENLTNDVTRLSKKMDTIENTQRREIKPDARANHLRVIERYFDDRCPLCCETCIMEQGTKNYRCEFDHFHGAKWNKLKETWPLCSDRSIWSLASTPGNRLVIPRTSKTGTEFSIK